MLNRRSISALLRLSLKGHLQVIGMAFFICGLLFTGQAAAQNTVTGAFQGDVSNNRTGDPVVGAEVQITNEQTAEVYNLRTDSKGRFYQGLLAPGFYQIRVTIPGFRPRLLRREIKVSLTGEVVPVPVSLEPESATTPSTPAVLEQPDDIRVEINTTDARRDGSTKKDEITKIPLGSNGFTRSFDEFALLLPGVAPAPQTIGDITGPGVGPGVGSAGQFAVNGLRSRGNNFTVDGSDNNDEDIGVRRQGFFALIPQPIESIQEFQIITLLAPAQFGRNIGAQVNAVSRAGGNQVNGSLYGFFNSNKLNARNFFDTTNGNDTFALRSASGQEVLLDGNPVTVRNQSGGEDSFTFGQGGAVLGGAIVQNKLFYFLSGEYQKITATQEKSFAVPTVEQRGAFRTGATGVFRNPFAAPNDPNGNVALIPTPVTSSALFSLFPFPNNLRGVYGANTFTQTLPSSGEGLILSGRIDHSFLFQKLKQSITGRYNASNDERNIPSVNEALFSTLLSRVRTDNLSLFFNSQLSGDASNSLFNQVRFSAGRTRLKFDEVRDSEFLISSNQLPNEPFFLNAPLRLNVTRPPQAGVPNTGPVNFSSVFTPVGGTVTSTVEPLLGPVGQVQIAGFSPLGVDVYYFPQQRINNTYQLADELSSRRGSHALVFGVDVRRTDLTSDLPRLSRPLVTFNGTPRLIYENEQFRFPTAADPNPIIRAVDFAALGATSNFLLTLNVDRQDAKAELQFYQFNFYGQDTWRITPKLSLSYGLRYEYNSPVKEASNLIENTFDDPRLSLTPGLRQFIGGRTQVYDPDRNNFAPRVGFAYTPNLFGKERTSVFRAGYGIFYDQILGAVVNQSRHVFPSYVTINFGGNTIGDNTLTFFNPAQTAIQNGSSIRQPGTVNQFNRNLTLTDLFQYTNDFFPNAITATLPARKLNMPMAHHYSFAFEQQINKNLTISISYVGTIGQKLLRFTTPNLGSSLTVAPTTFEIGGINTTTTGTLLYPRQKGIVFDPNRPVAGVGAINQFETTASSRYDSLQTELRGRFTKLLDFQLSYTFANAKDEVSDVFDLAGAYALPQNSFNLKGERGAASFDIRHNFAYNLTFNFPQLTGANRFWHVIADGLEISKTGRFHTGQPFTVNSTIDTNLDGNLTDRLNTTNGILQTGNGAQPLILATDNLLSLLAPFGEDGQVVRNSFRADKFLQIDLSVLKRFAIGNQTIIFRTDIFNVANRANFGIPVRLLEAPGFGRATNTVTPARRVQFSLKYEF